jgi:glucuronokinase
VFASLSSLAGDTATHGYYGGVRLLRSLCYRFHGFCSAAGISLHARGFTLAYTTTIPKQTGLSGSSSILVAGLRCLMRHYGVTVPLEEQPALVLACETDLGIVAGLQDRVIQCYEGVVYMDFSDARAVTASGRGVYTQLPASCLPPLHLVYAQNPGDSGKVHSVVRARWDAGDALIRAKMQEVAGLAERGRELLLQGTPALAAMATAATGTEVTGAERVVGIGGVAAEERSEGAAAAGERAGELARLMNINFDLRREMFGDAALGAMNVDMVLTPRSVGAAAKFTGSGGAAVVFCPGGAAQVHEMVAACEAKGFTVCPVVLNPPPGTHPQSP